MPVWASHECGVNVICDQWCLFKHLFFLPGTEFYFLISFGRFSFEICADWGMENYCFDLGRGRKVNVNSGSQVERKQNTSICMSLGKQNTYNLYVFWKAYSPLERTWPLKNLGSLFSLSMLYLSIRLLTLITHASFLATTSWKLSNSSWLSLGDSIHRQSLIL